MHNVKNMMNQRKNRVVAIILAAALVLGSAAVGLATTLATDASVEIEFRQPNSALALPIVANQETRITTGGTYTAETSNPFISEVRVDSATGQAFLKILAAARPGVLSVALADRLTELASINVQLFDPNGLKKVTLPNGGKLPIPNISNTTTNINNYVVTDPASFNKNDILWDWSSASSVITSISTAGVITPSGNGTAMVLGTVVDQWGVSRTFPVLVAVGPQVQVISVGSLHYVETDQTMPAPGNQRIHVRVDNDGRIIAPATYWVNIQANPPTRVYPNGTGGWTTTEPDCPCGNCSCYVECDGSCGLGGCDGNCDCNCPCCTGTCGEDPCTCGDCKPSIGTGTGNHALPPGQVGVAYTATIPRTGTAPITWTLEPGSTLPPGLTTLNATTGVISGTPTTAGTHTFTVRATNANGSATRQITLQIVDATVDVVITDFRANSGTLQAGRAGAPGPNTALSAQVLVMCMTSGDETWEPYNALTHGGTLAWALDPVSGQPATLAGNFVRAIAAATPGTRIMVRGTFTPATGSPLTAIGNWYVINDDGTIGGGAENEPIGVKGRTLSAAFVQDTSDWHEIAIMFIDGQSFSLIIRDRLLSQTSNWHDRQNIMNTWWTNPSNISMLSILRLYTYLPSSLPDGPIGTTNGGEANNFHNGRDGHGFFATGWSSPDPNRQVVSVNGTLFPLSYAEAARFCSMQHRNNGTGSNINSNEIARHNWGRLFDRTTSPWLLRSPSNVHGGSAIGSGLDGSGIILDNIIGPAAPTTHRARPALWVDSRIFDY